MIRNGYDVTHGIMSDSTFPIWDVQTPSGKKYKIVRNCVCDENQFFQLYEASSFNNAIKKIYEWEDNNINVLPDLTNPDTIIDLIKSYTSTCLYELFRNNLLIPNLQTAVYIFNLLYEKNNAFLASFILNNISMTENEKVTFLKYTIRRDYKCAVSVPPNLIEKYAKNGKAYELFIPSDKDINPEWLEKPAYGDKVKVKIDFDMEEER